jgi:hypothetical protein
LEILNLNQKIPIFKQSSISTRVHLLYNNLKEPALAVFFFTCTWYQMLLETFLKRLKIHVYQCFNSVFSLLKYSIVDYKIRYKRQKKTILKTLFKSDIKSLETLISL